MDRSKLEYMKKVMGYPRTEPIVEEVPRYLPRDITERELLIFQEWKCGLCGSEGISLYLDHNHRSGVARAYVCPSCNVNIGIFESPYRGKVALELEEKIVSYLWKTPVDRLGDQLLQHNRTPPDLIFIYDYSEGHGFIKLYNDNANYIEVPLFKGARINVPKSVRMEVSWRWGPDEDKIVIKDLEKAEKRIKEGIAFVVDGVRWRSEDSSKFEEPALQNTKFDWHGGPDTAPDAERKDGDKVSK